MKDFKLDENGDLLIENGDFVIASDVVTDNQSFLYVVKSEKGWWRRKPLNALSAIDFINSPSNVDDIKIALEKELYRDNRRIFSIDISVNDTDDYIYSVNSRFKN